MYSISVKVTKNDTLASRPSFGSGPLWTCDGEVRGEDREKGHFIKSLGRDSVFIKYSGYNGV
jgi:hypothetical protein